MTCRCAVRAAVCAVLVVCAPRSGRAQDEPARDREPARPLSGQPQEPSPSDEVIVIEDTGPLDAGASSERVVDADELALTPARSADDLLRLVPGLHIAQHAAEGKAQQFFLRGFDAVHGSDLAVSVAGVPLNEPSNVHGHGYVDLGFVLPEVVVSLAARKGSFALAQSDFATAGSVDLGLGVAQRGARVGYEVGTTNRHRVLGVVAPASLPGASFVAIEAMRDAGFGDNRGTERATLLAQHRFMLAPDRWLDVLAAGYAARFGAPGVVPLADYEAGRIGFYDSYNADTDGASARALVAVRYRDETGAGALELRAHAQWRRLRLAENFTGYLAYPDEGDLREQRHEAATAGASAWWQRRVSRWLELVAGADARADALAQSDDQLDDDGEPWLRTRELHAVELAAGAAAGARLGWGPRFRAEAGLRVDALWLRADDALADDGPASDALATVSPRLVAARVVAPGWTVFGAYGHGFRSPEARSAGGTTDFTTSRAAELGATGHAGAAGFGVTAFGIWISDELVFDHLSGVNLARNATRRLGVEVFADYRPVSWLAVRADGTVVDARFVDSGSPVPGAPRALVRGAAQAEHPSGWRAGGLVTYMAPRPLAHGAEGAAFTVIDVAGGYRTGRYDLELQIDNLLGARWREGEFHYASRFHRDEPVSQIPRLHYSAGRPLGARLSLTVWL